MRHYTTFLIFCFFKLSLVAQLELSLEKAIQLAKEQSVASKIAENIRENKYFIYRTFLADLRPQLSMNANLPSYSRDFLDVRQPDGSVRFIARTQNNAQLGLGLLQNIPLTGGQISMHTDFTRFDDFDRKFSAYTGNPVSIRYTQPLFAFNALKWNKIIEKLKYEESGKAYKFQMEDLALQVVDYYFKVLDAQTELEIAQNNLRSNQLVKNIEEKRVVLGATSREKLLQIEIQVLRAGQSLKKAGVDLKTALFNLSTLLGAEEQARYKLAIPVFGLGNGVDEATLHRQALENRPEFVAFQRRKLEADRDLEEARKSRNQVMLQAAVGFNGAGEQLTDVFDPIKDQQRLSVGVNVPIWDWGRSKAKIGIAEANQKVVRYTLQQEELNLKREVSNLFENIQLLRENILLAQKTDSIGLERYTLALEQYQLGRLSITDLNVASSEKDEAKRTHLNAVRVFWESYFRLRKLTLFDIQTGQKL